MGMVSQTNAMAELHTSSICIIYFNIIIFTNINGYLCTNNVYCVNTCFRFYILLTSQIKLLICLTNVVAGSQNTSHLQCDYWSCPTIFSFATGSRSILETVIQAIWQSVHRPRFRHLFSFSSKDVNVFQFLELIRFADNNHHSFTHISFVR